jgi:lipopolysaccharide assembly outer membrane protein LptD (OstA)
MTDAADDLIAERRLHAAVDNGELTADDVILANLMRTLLARGNVSITVYSGDSGILVEFPATSVTMAREEFAAVDRFYSQRSQP